MVKKQGFKETFPQLGNSDNCYQLVITSQTTPEIFFFAFFSSTCYYWYKL